MFLIREVAEEGSYLKRLLWTYFEWGAKVTAIEVLCPHCSQRLLSPINPRGHQLLYQGCGSIIVVPANARVATKRISIPVLVGSIALTIPFNVMVITDLLKLVRGNLLRFFLKIALSRWTTYPQCSGERILFSNALWYRIEINLGIVLSERILADPNGQILWEGR
jgi:hypothetical protein